MAKFFILGEAETQKLWLVDVEGETVEALSLEKLPTAGDKSLVQLVNHAREHNIILIKGVDVAISMDSRSEAATMSLSENETINNKDY
ncbi:hypothetical protein [Phyllobacterium sp. K27]